MIERFILSLEETPVTVLSWLGAFLGVVWVRYFIEPFSSPDASGYIPSDFVSLTHFTLYYLAILFAIVVVVHVVSKISAPKLLTVSIFILPLIWVGPLLDLIRGMPAKITYVVVQSPTEFFTYFLTFFGRNTEWGATVGLRIEIACILLLIGYYVYLYTRRMRTAVFSAVGTYAALYLSAVLPSLIGAVTTAGLATAVQSSLLVHTVFHPSEFFSAPESLQLLSMASVSQALYLILCAVGFGCFYFINKRVLLAVLHNIRLERVAHYLAAAVIGGLLALAEGALVSWSLIDVVTVCVAAMVVILAWVLAVIINDLVDEPIDAISNQERPLVTGALSRREMHDAGVICATLLVLGALALGSYSLFFISVYTALSYIYSMPPLRLKRIPVFASVLIGLATLVMMFFGFFLISSYRELSVFPWPIALQVLLSVSLLANIRDLKDIRGDALAGIWTLPTLLGDRRSRWVIGAMTFLASLLIPLFIPISVLWVPSLVVGIVSWLALVWGSGDKLIFAVYFAYLAVVVGLLSVV